MQRTLFLKQTFDQMKCCEMSSCAYNKLHMYTDRKQFINDTIRRTLFLEHAIDRLGYNHLKKEITFNTRNATYFS